MALAAGADVFYSTTGKIFQNAGLSYHFLVDQDVPDRGHKSLSSDGWGHLASVWITLFRFRLSAEYWTADNFISEEGEPFYRTERDYISWGIERKERIAGTTDFNASARFHWLEGRLEYQYGFGFRTRWSIPLHKG
jgi:hypothetical protein